MSRSASVGRTRHKQRRDARSEIALCLDHFARARAQRAFPILDVVESRDCATLYLREHASLDSVQRCRRCSCGCNAETTMRLRGFEHSTLFFRRLEPAPTSAARVKSGSTAYRRRGECAPRPSCAFGIGLGTSCARTSRTRRPAPLPSQFCPTHPTETRGSRRSHVPRQSTRRYSRRCQVLPAKLGWFDPATETQSESSKVPRRLVREQSG